MSTEAADVGTSAGVTAATAAVVVGFSSLPLVPSPVPAAAPFQPRPSDPMLLSRLAPRFPSLRSRDLLGRARGESRSGFLRAETRRNKAKRAHPVRFDRRRGELDEGSVTRRERERERSGRANSAHYIAPTPLTPRGGPRSRRLERRDQPRGVRGCPTARRRATGPGARTWTAEILAYGGGGIWIDVVVWDRHPVPLSRALSRVWIFLVGGTLYTRGSAPAGVPLVIRDLCDGIPSI
jgi:hypothetical protein